MDKFTPSIKTHWFLLSILLGLVTFSASSKVEAKTYPFADLYKSLNYTPAYFAAPAGEVESLQTYMNKQNDFYVEINTYLRKNTNEEIAADKHSLAARDIKNIDSLISRVPRLPSDIILFRGVTLNWHKNNSPFEIGEEYIDRAYSSTSTSLEIAEKFALGKWYPSSDNFKDETAVMTLYFQTDEAQGIMIDQGEDEVLLAHGLKFRIMSMKIVKEKKHYLVQICQKVLCDPTVTRSDVLNYWSERSPAQEKSGHPTPLFQSEVSVSETPPANYNYTILEKKCYAEMVHKLLDSSSKLRALKEKTAGTLVVGSSSGLTTKAKHFKFQMRDQNQSYEGSIYLDMKQTGYRRATSGQGGTYQCASYQDETGYLYPNAELKRGDGLLLYSSICALLMKTVSNIDETCN